MNIKTSIPPIAAAVAVVCLSLAACNRPVQVVSRVAHIRPGSDEPRDMQAVIDQFAELGGGTVNLMAGQYRLRDALRLRSGVKIIGVPGKTVFVIGHGRKTALAKDVSQGDVEITLTDAEGFELGDGIALEDKAGHGFEVTTATLVERLGPNTFRLSQPAESDYLVSRGAEVKRAFSGVGGWKIRDAELEGVTVEGNFGQEGSEFLGGCRGGGIYLFASENVAIRGCAVRHFNGDAISFQKNCRDIIIEDCLCENNANAGLHPGSGSHTSIVRNNTVRNNGYVGLFVCVNVKHVLFERNQIVDNGGCGISIGYGDSDNIFLGNRITDNAETGILFRRDSPEAENGAHRNRFEQNVVRDNLGPRPAKSNSRPDSAGQACVVIEGKHDALVFRDNEFGFSEPHVGSAILHDASATNLDASNNRLQHLEQVTKERPTADD